MTARLINYTTVTVECDTGSSVRAIQHHGVTLDHLTGSEVLRVEGLVIAAYLRSRDRWRVWREIEERERRETFVPTWSLEDTRD